MKKLIVSLILVFLLLGSGCAQKQQDTSQVRVVLDWTPNTNHTGMYVALEKGWYSEEGLSVEIQQPPESSALALVAAGGAEVAVDFQESMGPAIASSNPLPVTAIAAVVQHNTSGIVSLGETGIRSAADLCGKSFAAWSTPVVTETIRYIVEQDGGKLEEVQIIYDEVTDAVSALQTGVDSIWVYYAWDGIATQVSGLDSSFLFLTDCDPIFDFYSPILVASNAWMETHPDKVKAFLKATARGYEFAIENPQEAAEILLKHAPELREDLVVESQKWLASQYKAEVSRWGEIDPDRWSRFYDWMYQRSLLERDLGTEGFTNEFLPQ
ncbi:MAG: ABC transporter substrate-binding protein [Oscillospiraceae bacterium]|jgi:ABC-type nitrate/sulfonate/bicarbonate transport system substrate-binding protein